MLLHCRLSLAPGLPFTPEKEIASAGYEGYWQYPAEDPCQTAPDQELEEGSERSEQAEADVCALQAITLAFVVVRQRPVKEVAEPGSYDDQGPAVGPCLPVIGGCQHEEDDADGGDDAARDG